MSRGEHLASLEFFEGDKKRGKKLQSGRLLISCYDNLMGLMFGYSAPEYRGNNDNLHGRVQMHMRSAFVFVYEYSNIYHSTFLILVEGTRGRTSFRFVFLHLNYGLPA